MRHSGAFLTMLTVVGSFLLCGPSRAENIFEMIFGGGRPPAQAHAARIYSPHRSVYVRHVAHKKREPSAASAGESPSPETMKLSYAEVWGGKPDGAGKCCENAADMIARVTRHDSTLREGDAFMTSDGLQVFVGDRLGETKFVPVGQARQMSRALKERLQAIEKAPSEQTTRATPAKMRAERTSAPKAKEDVAEKERLIDMPNGKTIRLVGGFVN